MTQRSGSSGNPAGGRVVRAIVPLLAVGALAVVIASGPGLRADAVRDVSSQVVPGISPEALAQIEALIQEKESRSGIQQKIDSQLIYEVKKRAGLPIAAGIGDLETDVPYAPDGHAVLDVRARVTPALLTQLAALGAEVTDAAFDGTSLRVHLDVDLVEVLAGLSDVIFVQPRQSARTSKTTGAVPGRAMSRKEWTQTRPLRRLLRESAAAFFRGGSVDQQSPNLVSPAFGSGSRASEGDITHRAFDARGTFHVDGTGIKIGVLSDGVANLAASQALGDLGPVTVLPGQTGTGDEGTAMLEIIHDLAPGAQLFFATAFTGIASFAQNIRDLRAAGCDIIVDDVFYFVETPFQDGAPGPTNTNGGAVIQAVKDVTASGALYFSSAGNQGNLNAGTAGVWEGDFVDGGPTSSPLAVGRVHSFGLQNFNTHAAASFGNLVTLHWSDPMGASSNDYDLFRLNTTGTTVLGSSTNIQNGTQDPFEAIVVPSAGNSRFVIVKKTAAVARFLHLNANDGRFGLVTAGQTHGHNSVNSVGAYGVAATPAFDAFGSPPYPVGPFPNVFNTGNTVELFSSDGPRRIFYEGNGTPITPGDVSSTGGLVLAKPDITAADGVAVTGVGGFPSPFFGTSAAAPHAAAIVALLKQAVPALTPAQVRSILTATAIDIDAPGIDRDSGAGIVMAQEAIIAAGGVGTAFLTLDNVVVAENPGDGNGAVNPGEGGKLVLALKNLGVADATAVSATLTTSTPAVTVTLPGMSLYPTVSASGAVVTGAGPFLFTVSSTASCPQVVDFNLAISYLGGPSPVNLPFQVLAGSQDITISSTLDTTAPTPVQGVSSAITGLQNARLSRNLVTSTCAGQKSFPGVFGTGTRRFDAYTIPACGVNNLNEESCVTVSLASTPAGLNAALFASAYKPSFDPNNLATNYLADAGNSNVSGGFGSFRFSLPNGPQTFVIDVNEVNQNLGLGANYTLKISGGCFGSCATPNQVPIAKARNVTVPAGADCTANASIDDGSFDADGDGLTITQSPPGPYPLGTTEVLLTVTDPKGATSQATATVTVVDTTGPSITGVSTVIVRNRDEDDERERGDRESDGNRERPDRDRDFVDVTVNYDSTDGCSPGGTCVLTVALKAPAPRDDRDDRNGDGDRDDPDHARRPDWIVVDAHHVKLRATDSHEGRGRSYTITITCSDGVGNSTIQTTSVVVRQES